MTEREWAAVEDVVARSPATIVAQRLQLAPPTRDIWPYDGTGRVLLLSLFAEHWVEIEVMLRGKGRTLAADALAARIADCLEDGGR